MKEDTRFTAKDSVRYGVTHALLETSVAIVDMAPRRPSMRLKLWLAIGCFALALAAPAARAENVSSPDPSTMTTASPVTTPEPSS